VVWPINLIEPLVFLACSVPILYYDVRERRIPDIWVLAGFLTLLAIRLWRKQLELVPLIAAVAGFTVFWLFRLVCKRRIGLGDAKLSALIGFLLGPWGWCLAVFLASLTGLLFLVARYALVHKPINESIPFAPFLILGALASFPIRPALLALLRM
jgi:leader peptidase (prepilin peptidase)/N-methyltransferase